MHLPDVCCVLYVVVLLVLVLVVVVFIFVALRRRLVSPLGCPSFFDCVAVVDICFRYVLGSYHSISFALAR